ncbi:MAG: hypothetical protein EBV84_09010, partial [Betaproteobacteria bacterium]|nr:hypothetical protein [Betaproteobacteria bacterium]
RVFNRPSMDVVERLSCQGQGYITEAVQAIGIRSRGLGIAIKIADGNARAMPWIVVEIFRQLGIGDSHQRQQLQELVARPIRNVRGDAVGCYRPVFTLSVA